MSTSPTQSPAAVSAVDSVFAPPGEQWTSISPKYLRVAIISSLITAVIVSSIPALIVGLGFRLWWISAIVWGIAAVILIIDLALAPRRVRAWRYALRDEDLYITHGVFSRSLTVVPYGRMQVVEVTAGPLERSVDLATIKFVTASAHTDATIPGVPAEAAAELRDRLTELGETRATGL